MVLIKFLIIFATKSLKRNKFRNIFLATAIIFAVSLSTWTNAVLDGMDHQIEEAVKNANVGDLQIQDSVSARSKIFSSPMSLSHEYLEELRKLPGVDGVSPELLLEGQIIQPEGVASVILIGRNDKEHAEIMELGLQEPLKDSDETSPKILIGDELAKKFKMRVGDTLSVQFQDREGSISSELFKIQGIFKKNGPSFEKKNIYIDRDYLKSLLFKEASSGQVLANRIILRTSTSFNLNSLKKLNEEFNLLSEIKSWRDINPEMSMVTDFHQAMGKYLLLIIGIIVFISILTPVTMIWQERHSELRTFKVIGIPNSTIWLMGFTEGLILALCSTLTSLIIIYCVIYLQSKTGIDLTLFGATKGVTRAGIQIDTTIYPLLSGKIPLMVSFIVLFVVVLSYGVALKKVLKEVRL